MAEIKKVTWRYLVPLHVFFFFKVHTFKFFFNIK